MRTRTLKVGVASAVAVTTVLAGASALTAPASATTRQPLKAVARSKPAWTAHAKHLGPALSTAQVHARVYLAPRGGFEALRKTATAISTPGSASYRHFLTRQAYTARFATTTGTVRSVSSYLRSTGLAVSGPGAANRYVNVRGTVAQAQRAFGAHIDNYVHSGKNVQAPSTQLKLPDSVASSVLTVTGLDTSAARITPASKQQAPPPDGFRNARPCSRYYGSVAATYRADFTTKLPKFRGKTLPYAPCGYTGPQFRGAYEGASNKLDGTGVTVAITDAYAAPTIRADANTYATRNGDGAYKSGQYQQTVPAKFTDQAACGPQGWYGEETLDVEAVHAMAPGANIHYYAAANCNDDGFLDALGQVVDDDTAKLVSNSWDGFEADSAADTVAAYEQVFLQGATEGISFMFSSGDDGDELASTGLRQVDYPASDPYVTAVGGTASAIGADNKFRFQTGWGTTRYSLSKDGKSWTSDGYLYGAGGGTSALFNRPDYQKGIVRGAARGVPDVAMNADPNTGMLVGETQTFPGGVQYDEYRIGGTSLASPLFAGMTALTLQRSGIGAGLLNPAIYQHRAAAFTDIAGVPADAGDVRVDYVNGVDAGDGLTYSVRTYNTNSSLTTGKGWDDTTGVGTANPGWLTALGNGKVS